MIVELKRDHPYVVSMQNPKQIKTLFFHSTRSYIGEVTKRSYRVGGNIKTAWVDERDVNKFLRMAKRGKRLFSLVKTDLEKRNVELENELAELKKSATITKETTLVEELEVEVDENDEVDLTDLVNLYDVGVGVGTDKDFTKVAVVENNEDEVKSDKYDFSDLEGVGTKTRDLLYMNNVMCLGDLIEVGAEWLSMLSANINSEKAENIIKQAEERLNSN